jgi:CHAD domain-containing protein
MDPAYRRLAAKYVQRQVAQLAEQLDGVRAAEDIEFVHRARVATRRLRAALRMFRKCFGAKKVKRWRKAIRRVTRSLGNARDRDVQIECLCKALSALNEKECFPGVARVMVQLERDRERFQRDVVEAVDRLEAAGILQQMRQATEKVLQEAASAFCYLPCPEACAPIKEHVLGQLESLLQHEGSLADPEAREHHHAMRIAAKRLRYALEISRPMCPGRLDESVDAVKKLQTLLGDLHDCDVWLAHLEEFAAAERKRIIALFGHAGRFVHLLPGIERLRKDRQGRRQRTFEELVKYWGELKERQFADQLSGAVEFDTDKDAEKEVAESCSGDGQGSDLGVSTERHWT